MVSLLTGSVVARFYDNVNGLSNFGNNGTSGNMTAEYEDMDSASPLPDHEKIAIVMSLALLVGVTQVRFWFWFVLSHKEPNKTAADDILIFVFLIFICV